MSDFKWFVLDVNPEPWAIGPLGVGRKNGKVYPYVGRNDQLFHYKEAVKEALEEQVSEGDFLEGEIDLKFAFWRRRDEYKTPQARTHRKHEADGTNLAKATEDALQGILFKNDKDVKSLSWTIVEQGAEVISKVVIGVRSHVRYYTLPPEVQSQIWAIDEEAAVPSVNQWRNQ